MITIISAWYNEEFLAELFLNNYESVDQIIIMLDESTDDGSREILDDFNGKIQADIVIKKLSMPKGLDDIRKQAQMNMEYVGQKHGWVIEVDADEFIRFPKKGLRYYLNQIRYDVVKVEYWQMYQHLNEAPLNRHTDIFKQRKYGKRNGLDRWNKPAILRAGRNYMWSCGHHQVDAPAGLVDPQMLQGAHVSMADQTMSLHRRINNHRDRQSEENFKNGLSIHNHEITPADIIRECDENLLCSKVNWREV